MFYVIGDNHLYPALAFKLFGFFSCFLQPGFNSGLPIPAFHNLRPGNSDAADDPITTCQSVYGGNGHEGFCQPVE